MTYTLNTHTGAVTRDSDAKQCAPAQSEHDPDFVGYLDWVALGNQPTEVSIAPPPTPAEVAKQAQDGGDNNAITAAKVNPVIQYLVTHTPAECAAKVQSDVTNLQTAKDMLGHFAVALCVLARDRLR